MADVYTDIANLVEGAEEVFNDYVIARIMEKSAFFRSGVVVPQAALVPQKGKFLHFPYFNELDGDDEVLMDNAGLEVNPITTGDQVAAILARGKMFGVNDLANLVSGETDILRAMANFVGDYWVRRYDRALVKTIDGSCFSLDAAYGAGSIVNDISAEVGALSNIDASVSYDTMQLLGEYSSDIRTIVMHSAVENWLNKQDLVDVDFPVSQSMPVKTYLGRQIVVDDRVSSSAGVYNTYFCRSGAVGFADGTPANLAVEFDRNISTGNNEMATRRRFVLHPGGASLDIATAETTEPSTNQLGYSNATIGTTGTWTNAFADANKFGIRVLKHKIDQ